MCRLTRAANEWRICKHNSSTVHKEAEGQWQEEAQQVAKHMHK